MSLTFGPPKGGWKPLKKKPRIYVAGPMRGLPGYNFPAFFHAEEMLRGLGWEVHNPARHDCEAYPELDFANNCELPEKFMNHAIAWDLEKLALESEAVYLLTGWEHSVGAHLELELAELIGIDIYEQGIDRLPHA